MGVENIKQLVKAQAGAKEAGLDLKSFVRKRSADAEKLRRSPSGGDEEKKKKKKTVLSATGQGTIGKKRLFGE